MKNKKKKTRSWIVKHKETHTIETYYVVYGVTEEEAKVNYSKGKTRSFDKRDMHSVEEHIEPGVVPNDYNKLLLR